MDDGIIHAEPSGTGNCGGVTREDYLPEPIQAADGTWRLVERDYVIGDAPMIEAAASTVDEQIMIDGLDAGVISSGMLTDIELDELDEHDTVLVGDTVFAYWRTDAQGMKWLKRVEY